MDWDPDDGPSVLDDWTAWGLARHPHFLQPADVAAAVAAVVAARRGAHLTLVEISAGGTGAGPVRRSR